MRLLLALLPVLACAPMIYEPHARLRDEVTTFRVPRDEAPEARRAAAKPEDEWVEVRLSDGTGGRMLAGELNPGLPPEPAERELVRQGGGSLQVLFQVHINKQGVAHLAQWISPADAPQAFVQHYKDHIATWRFEPFLVDGRPVHRLLSVFLRYPGLRLSS